MRVRCMEIKAVVENCGVDGVKKNRQHLLGACAEMGLFLANHQNADVH